MKSILQMGNPWCNLPNQAPYVLPEDSNYICAFNEFNGDNRPDTEINLNLIPEPRLGSINAPVFLLQLNPSYELNEQHGHLEQNYIDNAFNSLRNEDHGHIGVLFDNSWWQRCLRELIKDIGNEKLANNICSIEFFPYRSRKFAHGQIRLPSQQYTFSMVRAALERNALIIISRNLPLWLAAIPELRDSLDETVFRLRNPLTATYSRNNLTSEVYEKVLNAINGN
jgi:hypothetical protein